MLIGITTKYGIKDQAHVIKRSVDFLKRNGNTIELCAGTCRLIPGKKPSLDFNKAYDLLLVFGGDGSLLRTLQFMKHFETPILSINMGRLGFFSEGMGKDYQRVLRKIIKKEYTIEPRMLLRCTVMRGSKRVFSHRALNEVTIARDALARMIALRTTVNDLKLTTYVADGLIVATPSGSTAYSLSAGGPVVSPELETIILTPISPHSFTQKPILLPSTSRIKVELSIRSQERVNLTVDGQIGFHLKEHDVIKIKKSSKTLRFVRLSKSTYFQMLRKKLHWGTDLEGR